MTELERNGARWPMLAIIGSYPPPYGGIGVHLQRLADRLDDAGVDFTLYNTVSSSDNRPHVVSVSGRKMRWYLWFCLRHRSRIVHLVTTNWYSRVLLGLCACIRPGTYVLSIHGRSISEALRRGGLRRLLTRWLLRRMDVVVACNSAIARECIEDAGLPAEKVRMVSAFIPPLPRCVVEPPDYVREFITSHTPVISAVGWVGQTFRGADVYGLDMMIRLVERLRADYPEIGLVLSVNGGQPAAVGQLVSECRAHAGGQILAITESLEDISAILRDSDVFVRPTNTDGDAVSIREALFLGTPVVASDAAPRPEPCVVYTNRDMDDFEQKVRQVIGSLDAMKVQVRAAREPDNSKALMDMYRQLLAPA